MGSEPPVTWERACEASLPNTPRLAAARRLASPTTTAATPTRTARYSTVDWPVSSRALLSSLAPGVLNRFLTQPHDTDKARPILRMRPNIGLLPALVLHDDNLDP